MPPANTERSGYASHPTFRRFVKDIDKYVCDFVAKKKRLVCSTVRFRINGLKQHVIDPLGNLRTRREMLGQMLAEMGHKVKIEKNGTLTAEKRYAYLPTEGYTIRINKNGSGLAKTSTKTPVLTPDNIESALCMEHLFLIEAMRCLCYHLDEKMKLVPSGSVFGVHSWMDIYGDVWLRILAFSDVAGWWKGYEALVNSLLTDCCESLLKLRWDGELD